MMATGGQVLFRVWLLAGCLTASLAYNAGEIVPMARRGQYHNMRTEWHDALGRHCPRFAASQEVVLPIPRPVGYTNGEPYKMSLMLGREKYVTTWLLIMGLRKIQVPMVDMELQHFGGELRGVRATVVPLPPDYLQQHLEVARQFQNSTHWPKHIMIRYKWVEHKEVDVTLGLTLLFGASAILTTVLAIFILQSSKEKLSKFVEEQIGDSGDHVPNIVAAKVD